MALLKLLPALDFLGTGFKASCRTPSAHKMLAGGDSKPAVKPGGAYDGSDINPEDLCSIGQGRGDKLPPRFCPFSGDGSDRVGKELVARHEISARSSQQEGGHRTGQGRLGGID